MRVPLRQRRRGDHGAAAVIVAMTTTVVIGFLAFVTDFGMAYGNKRGLQNGADAAALAVAQEIAVKGIEADPTASCTEIANAWAGPGRDMADAYFARNHAVTGATISAFSLTCPTATQLVVSVGTTQASPTFFGGLTGTTEINLRQTAHAGVGPIGAVIGIRPFAVCEDDAQNIKDNPEFAYNVIFDSTTDRGCGTASGNWGLLDLDEDIPGNGKAEVGKHIRDGYDGEIGTCPDADTECIEGKPGAPGGALNDDMTGIFGEDIVIPVYDYVTGGNGANVSYHITGFIAVQICGFKFNSQFQDTDPAFASQVPDPCYSSTALPTPPSGGGASKGWVQVQFRKMIPVGDRNVTCDLGDETCDFGIRVFSLDG